DETATGAGLERRRRRFRGLSVLGLGSSASATLSLTQPARFLIPFGFFLCLPAAAGASKLLEAIAARRPAAMALAGLVAVILAESAHGVGWAPLGTGHDAAESAVVEFLGGEALPDDRVLAESSWQRTPAYPGARADVTIKRFGLLPLALHRECLGYAGTGPISVERYAAFAGGWLFGRELRGISATELDELLRRFAISWIVACRPATRQALERFPSLVERAATASDCVVFRVRNPERSRLIAGGGEVRAGLDRIEVRNAAGPVLVLKYHWLPTLHTVPPLRIEEARQPGSPVGFIAVHPAGAREFAVVQRSGPW
ncbi:MAG: hypothetical protein ACREQ9_04220, partial [Candidatus Binatia bacterium]